MQNKMHQYAEYAIYLIMPVLDRHTPHQRRLELQQPEGLRRHALPACVAWAAAAAGGGGGTCAVRLRHGLTLAQIEG